MQLQLVYPHVYYTHFPIYYNRTRMHRKIRVLTYKNKRLRTGYYCECVSIQRATNCGFQKRRFVAGDDYVMRGTTAEDSARH